MRLSIVTPSLNAQRFIAEAVASVADAGSAEIEHIVVDGGSTDGTLETLRRQAHLRVLVRPGLRLYPALNLGVAEASGDVIGFLNADDRYLPGALGQAAAALAAAPEADCASGGARVVRLTQAGGRERVIEHNSAPHKLLDWDPLLFGAPVINARFFRKSFVKRLGGFDARYAIAADREWLIRAKLAGMRLAAIDTVVYEYREHAASLTINRDRTNAARIRDEHCAIMRQYVGDPRARGIMRRWHAWETGRDALRHLAHGEIALAGRVAREGTAESALWLPRFLAEAPMRVVARLAR
ncbi:MAG TPA: glycosyltransferase [Stellaceae bacterium]